MVDNSANVIAYIHCGYGGAYEAMRYAKRINKQVINLTDDGRRKKSCYQIILIAELLAAGSTQISLY